MRKNDRLPKEISLPEFVRALLPVSAQAMADDLVGFAKAAWPILMPFNPFSASPCGSPMP